MPENDVLQRKTDWSPDWAALQLGTGQRRRTPPPSGLILPQVRSVQSFPATEMTLAFRQSWVSLHAANVVAADRVALIAALIEPPDVGY